MWAFVRNHLAGKLSLAVSFWVNFLFLSFAYYLVEPALLGPLRDRPMLFFAGTIAFLSITVGVVFPWQVIGVLRCADNHYKNNHDPVLLRTVQGVVLVAGLSALVHLLESAQTLTVYARQLEERDVERSTPVRYVLEISPNGRWLNIDGTLDHGITRDVRDLLASDGTIEGVVLSSTGGMIYEGRGLAHAIEELALATYVFSECSSACATAFMGGKTRFLGPHAKLGFHRYKFEGTHLRQFAGIYDVEAEQGKDLAFYERQGVSEQFQQMIFSRPPQEIWFPRHDLLLSSGVAHTIITSAEPPPE